ncbi:MAG TPA: TatD family hydrolase [Polyangia bacterium]|nr:TatD family hydrolase [Polyangia bacterium]
MIDSHCHLDFVDYAEDRLQVLARARQAGVSAMICIGSGGSVTSARNATALAGEETDIYAAVGIHPHDVNGMSDADWTELASLARASRVVGIGETGLDYHYDHSPRPVQQQAYRRFIELARTVERPVISHVRDAHADAAAILAAEGARDTGGVIHCFTGDVSDARRYLDLGQYLSFSGILTFKNAAPVREAAAFAPAGRILIETDAPFLAPIPFRGKRNEPSFIVKTLETLAALRGSTVAAMDDVTSENTRRLFKLPV